MRWNPSERFANGERITAGEPLCGSDAEEIADDLRMAVEFCCALAAYVMGRTGWVERRRTRNFS
jgi:hypothetical protein